jgi:PAS domain S-box-containing protein
MELKMEARFPLRLFIVLYIPVALLILSGGWYLAHGRIDAEMDLIRSDEINTIVLGVRRMDNELEVPLHQLRTLAEEEAVRRAIDGIGSGAAMETTFLTLIARNEIYDKARWIDKTGMERVRAGRVAEGVELVPKNRLQNLVGSYYFTKTMRLRPGQVYISPLDLNIEHGRTEVPYKPVLRLGTSVQERSGRPRGILLVDVDGRRLLDDFTESMGNKRDHVMLVSPEGYWLVSPDSKDEWGFMFQRKETLGTRSPEAWKAISRNPNGQVELEDGLWTWSTVYPLKVEESRDIEDVPYWLVISHLPDNQLVLVRERAWQTVGVMTLILLAVFGLLATWLALALTGRTRAKVEAARAHATAEAAKRLYEAQERFNMAVKANINGVLVGDREGRIVMANPALERMFGYGKGELIGQPLETLLPEPERSRHVKDREAYMRTPVARAMGTGRDLQGRRRDGSVFPVEISLSPFTADGKQFVDAVVADISERKHNELRLKKSEARLQMLVQTNPNGLLVVNAEGRIQMVNPALERMFGYSPGELIDQPVECLVPDASQGGHMELRTQFQQNPSTRPMGAGLDLHGRRKDGSTFPIEVSLASFTEDNRVFVQATVIEMTGSK